MKMSQNEPKRMKKNENEPKRMKLEFPQKNE